MVYQINQKILTLQEYGVENFRNELCRIRDENNIYDKKNQDWFKYLPERFEQYKDWFFLFDNDKPVAFSAIQEYYPGCYRLLTRTYIYREYRRFTNPKHHDEKNPTMMFRLLPYQLDCVKGYNTIFVSMQDLKNRNTLLRFNNRLIEFTKSNWQVEDDMILTCEKDWGSTCWQNVVYNGTPPNLQRISIDEWKLRYDR